MRIFLKGFIVSSLVLGAIFYGSYSFYTNQLYNLNHLFGYNTECCGYIVNGDGRFWTITIIIIGLVCGWCWELMVDYEY